MLYGVIKFHHPEIDHTETVPFLSEAQMHADLTRSLKTGFPPEQISCWVRDKAAAEKLFGIMDANGGVRSRCFELNHDNVDFVLA